MDVAESAQGWLWWACAQAAEQKAVDCSDVARLGGGLVSVEAEVSEGCAVAFGAVQWDYCRGGAAKGRAWREDDSEATGRAYGGSTLDGIGTT